MPFPNKRNKRRLRNVENILRRQGNLGITIKCVSCKKERVLPFEAAKDIGSGYTPKCDNCGMPCIAIAANT